MTDLDLFCRCLDGNWAVERYELEEGDRLRVHFRSLTHPTVTWSMLPFEFSSTPPVGAVGRVCFQWEKR